MALTLNDAAALPANEARDDGAMATARAEPSIRVGVTLEVVLYVVLAVLALALRTATLGDAPLNDGEAHDALAALRAVNPRAPGDDLVAQSPITFLADAISFTVLPPDNAAARLPVALGGVLLALAPALWRRYLNLLPPLIMSLMLAISPVALLAARTSSPVIWSALLAIVAPWLVLRFIESGQRAWAVLATAAFAALALLAEPAGFLLLLGMAFGVVFAWLTEVDPDAHIGQRARAVVRGWPWMSGALAAGLLVALVATGMFFLPAGLTAIGNVIWTGLQGFVTRPDGTPEAFPLWIVLRYEPGLLLFGIIACYRAMRVGGFFERALAGWFVAGLVVSMVYAGATAAHALWMVLPLTVLVGLMVTRWLTERAAVIWQVPSWGMPLHAAITLALWFAVGMSVILLGKLVMVDLPGQVTELSALASKLTEAIYSRNNVSPNATYIGDVPIFEYVLGFIQWRLLITVLVSMLVGVLFFLVGSLWGARSAWRGLALGTLLYLMLYGAGAAGRAAFDAPGDPRVLWYAHPVTADVQEMRGSLHEMSLRDNGIENLIPITALVPQDGALAWALHDFPNTIFVDGVGAETNTAAVIMPWSAPEPGLGADYIGRELVTRQAWEIGLLSWKDTLTWLYEDDSLIKPVPLETMMLWVRKDVYGVEQVPSEE